MPTKSGAHKKSTVNSKTATKKKPSPPPLDIHLQQPLLSSVRAILKDVNKDSTDKLKNNVSESFLLGVMYDESHFEPYFRGTESQFWANASTAVATSKMTFDELLTTMDASNFEMVPVQKRTFANLHFDEKKWKVYKKENPDADPYQYLTTQCGLVKKGDTVESNTSKFVGKIQFLSNATKLSVDEVLAALAGESKPASQRIFVKFRLEPGYWKTSVKSAPSLSPRVRSLLVSSFGYGQAMAPTYLNHRFEKEGLEKFPKKGKKDPDKAKRHQWVAARQSALIKTFAAADVEEQIKFTGKELKRLLQAAKGDKHAAYVGYNSGSINSKRADANSRADAVVKYTEHLKTKILELDKTKAEKDKARNKSLQHGSRTGTGTGADDGHLVQALPNGNIERDPVGDRFLAERSDDRVQTGGAKLADYQAGDSSPEFTYAILNNNASTFEAESIADQIRQLRRRMQEYSDVSNVSFDAVTALESDQREIRQLQDQLTFADMSLMDFHVLQFQFVELKHRYDEFLEMTRRAEDERDFYAKKNTDKERVDHIEEENRRRTRADLLERDEIVREADTRKLDERNLNELRARKRQDEEETRRQKDDRLEDEERKRKEDEDRRKVLIAEHQRLEEIARRKEEQEQRDADVRVRILRELEDKERSERRERERLEKEEKDRLQREQREQNENELRARQHLEVVEKEESRKRETERILQEEQQRKEKELAEKELCEKEKLAREREIQTQESVRAERLKREEEERSFKTTGTDVLKALEAERKHLEEIARKAPSNDFAREQRESRAREEAELRRTQEDKHGAVYAEMSRLERAARAHQDADRARIEKLAREKDEVAQREAQLRRDEEKQENARQLQGRVEEDRKLRHEERGEIERADKDRRLHEYEKADKDRRRAEDEKADKDRRRAEDEKADKDRRRAEDEKADKDRRRAEDVKSGEVQDQQDLAKAEHNRLRSERERLEEQRRKDADDLRSQDDAKAERARKDSIARKDEEDKQREHERGGLERRKKEEDDDRLKQQRQRDEEGKFNKRHSSEDVYGAVIRNGQPPIDRQTNSLNTRYEESKDAELRGRQQERLDIEQRLARQKDDEARDRREREERRARERAEAEQRRKDLELQNALNQQRRDQQERERLEKQRIREENERVRQENKRRQELDGAQREWEASQKAKERAQKQLEYAAKQRQIADDQQRRAWEKEQRLAAADSARRDREAAAARRADDQRRRDEERAKNEALREQRRRDAELRRAQKEQRQQQFQSNQSRPRSSSNLYGSIIKRNKRGY